MRFISSSTCARRHCTIAFMLFSLASATTQLPLLAQAPSTGRKAAAKTPAANLPPKLSTVQLESNAKITSAANTIAVGIIREYQLNGKLDPCSDLNSYLNDLDSTIIGQSKVPVLASGLAASDQDTAKAQSTTAQTNTQNGAPASSDGSTSAAQKVGIPQLLGLAVENGAVTNTTRGTTMTLSTTPYAFVTAFDRKQDTAKNYYDSTFVTHLGISSTFNVANTADPLQSATRKAISQWQAKYTFFDTSARSRKVEMLYMQDVYPAAETMLSAYDHLNAEELAYLEKLRKAAVSAFGGAGDACNGGATGTWATSLLPIVKAAANAKEYETGKGENTDKLAAALLKALDSDSGFHAALTEAEQDAGIAQATSAYWTAHDGAYSAALKKFQTAVKDLPKGNSHGFNGDAAFGEVFPTSTTSLSGSSSASSSLTSSTSTGGSTTAKPPTPAYLQGEADLAYTPPTALAKQNPGIPSLTANFIGSLYPNPNLALNETTLRGGKVAVMSQWDLPPGPFKQLLSLNDKSKMTIALSSSYERLQENHDQKGKKADILLGNVKISVPLPGGVSFPLAMSFANATSQVKGNYIVGNFGITFNLDALAALAKAKQ